MEKIYKVTAANIKKTQKGYDLFSLQLNNSFWATKLAPLREVDKLYDPLYRFYEKNNRNLNSLTGCYISVFLEDTKFGKNFSYTTSLDVIGDFKKLLDNSKGKAFVAEMNVFDFLKEKGRVVNPDGTITLKEPYSVFNIKYHDGKTICYPNNAKDGDLTLNNLEVIYDEFFKGKHIETSRDRSEEYAITPVSIKVVVHKFRKSETGIESSHSSDVLRVGDQLSEEQYNFICGLNEFG